MIKLINPLSDSCRGILFFNGIIFLSFFIILLIIYLNNKTKVYIKDNNSSWISVILLFLFIGGLALLSSCINLKKKSNLIIYE